MKKILRKHLEIVLAVLAIVLLSTIIALFVWGVNNMVASMNNAMSAKGSAGENTSFNLDAAKQLDLRGLVNQGQ